MAGSSNVFNVRCAPSFTRSNEMQRFSHACPQRGACTSLHTLCPDYWVLPIRAQSVRVTYLEGRRALFDGGMWRLWQPISQRGAKYGQKGWEEQGASADSGQQQIGCQPAVGRYRWREESIALIKHAMQGAFREP